MAHGDYDCCAVCDSKQSYSHDARTKEEICSPCLKDLRAIGANVLDVEELLAWMKATPNAREKLASIGFAECFYSNRVDDVYKSLAPRIPAETGEQA